MSSLTCTSLPPSEWLIQLTYQCWWWHLPWHLSREVIPRPWPCSGAPCTRACTRTPAAGSGARTWSRYHTASRSTGPRCSHAPGIFSVIFFVFIFCLNLTSSESRARLCRLTMTSPLRMSLWMAPSSPMMMPDSGLTLYRCLQRGTGHYSW